MTAADRLLDVMRVLQPHNKYLERTVDPVGVWIGNEIIRPNSKDDLARVIAMLSPEQRKLFDIAVHVIGKLESHSPSSIINAESAVWVKALCAAVGIY